MYFAIASVGIDGGFYTIRLTFVTDFMMDLLSRVMSVVKEIVLPVPTSILQLWFGSLGRCIDYISAKESSKVPQTRTGACSTSERFLVTEQWVLW